MTGRRHGPDRTTRREMLAGAGAIGVVAALSGAPGDPAVAWEDDFHGSRGCLPDHWQFDRTAAARAGRMTARNAFLDGEGHFVLTARSTGDMYTCTQVFGSYPARGIRIGQSLEFRAKLPVASGVWPALWTMGANAPHHGPGNPPATGWPACGETDLVEVMYAVSSTHYFSHLHGPDGPNVTNWRIARPPVDTGWHTYGAVFQTDSVSFFLDGALTGIGERSARPPGSDWVFDQPQFPLITIAVGGPDVGEPHFSGQVDLLVDHVRCYHRSPYPTVSVETG